MVRLKVFYVCKIAVSDFISIPHGTIKSLDTGGGDLRINHFNSTWYD